MTRELGRWVSSAAALVLLTAAVPRQACAQVGGTPMQIPMLQASPANGGARLGTVQVPLTWGLTTGVQYSDNIEHVAVDPRSEVIAEAGLNAQVATSREHFDGQLATNIEYVDYTRNTSPSQLLGGIYGNGTYWLLPQRLSWVLQDNFGQTYIDARQVQTPQNRQNTNYLTTGPNVQLPLGERTNLLLQGRWSASSYAQTDADDHRESGAIGLEQQLSERSTFSLNGSYQHVQLQRVSGVDYAEEAAFAAFEISGSRTRMSAQAGVSELNGFGTSSKAPLLTLSLSRSLSSHSTITFNAGTSFTDSAQVFARDQLLTGISLANQNAVITTDPYKSDYASLDWTIIGARTTIDLGVNWSRDRHDVDTTFNRTMEGAKVYVTRRLTSVFGMSAGATWLRQSFAISDVRFSEWSIGAGLDWHFSRTLMASLQGGHNGGSGAQTASVLGAYAYSENTVSLSISFTPRR